MIYSIKSLHQRRLKINYSGIALEFTGSVGFIKLKVSLNKVNISSIHTLHLSLFHFK